MSDKSRMKVVLCWHMHQPDYRNLLSGEYQLPWVYLHATKDYVDMAAHLEAVPGARAVVNFAPVLLDQLADYAAQINGFLNDGIALRDPLLAALGEAALPVRAEQQLNLVSACLRLNEARQVSPVPQFRRLVKVARWVEEEPEALIYLGEQFLGDLLTWYHLAWLGETVRQRDARIKRLLDKGSNYTVHDRLELLGVISELLGGLVGRYRALAERGQVELSMSPMAHPMIPLLLDLKCAREAMPDAELPLLDAYPGGERRARWHIEQGLKTFERHFGFRPRGCWPSEGGVSAATLALLKDYGLEWAASGQAVLHNSLYHAGRDTTQAREFWLFQPYRFGSDDGVACFFRDDELSDLIGFTYADWHGDDAVSNLVHNLEMIASVREDNRNTVVPIILDGENAWEYYPNNGYYFLSALYQRLADHPQLELTTFSACLDAGMPTTTLQKIVSGSWVYGSFSTWIGDPDKNRAWDVLGEAKRVFDRAVESGRLSGEAYQAALAQLAACEGSDWFWWFGDYNPAATVSDFERLYRLHLANLYHLCGAEPPDHLSRALSRGGGAPAAGGTMRHGQSEVQ
ncbi:MAG TPA: glycoside hydrolase [Gammaproteobacteria bacterium]|nr:glycoside hydrolase [Gammaproteobacteria bacterium]